MARAVPEHQGLHGELDVHHAALAVLHVEQRATVAAALRMGRAHALAHGLHLLQQQAELARRGQHRASHGLDPWRERRRPGAPACARDGLVLPGPGGVAAALSLVTLEGGDGGDEQPRVAIGPQRGVDVEQLAGRGAQGEPADELSREGGVDLGRAVGVGLVGVVEQKHDVEVGAVAQLLAAELAVGDHGEARVVAVALLQVLPGPADGAVERGVGERREVVGHLLDAQFAVDVAHQGAKHLGVVGAAQGVQQRLFVGLAATRPGAVARLEFVQIGGALEAALQGARIGKLVDHAGMAHEVAHGPTRQAQEAQQPHQHFAAFGQQGEVAFAAQQRLEPVDEAQHRRVALGLVVGTGVAELAFVDRLHRARNQARQTQLGVVAQQRHARRRTENLQPCRHRRRLRLDEGGTVDRLRQTAAVAACAGGGARRRRAPVVQQRVELRGDELAVGAQGVEQFAGVGGAGQAHRAGEPGQIGVVGGQLVGLLVVEVLDAVLEAAQKAVGLGQPRGGAGAHDADGGQAIECGQGGARAQLRELAAAHHLQQLHGELDLADAAARELDVVGALGPAGGAPRGVVADLAVQLAQAFEHAVVEVAAKHEGDHHVAQAQRLGAADRRGGRHDAALQPGETLPLAPLH